MGWNRGAVLIAAFALWLCPAPAHALDPSLGIQQFKHSRWTVDDGAPAGIFALAQTPDGFLWIGSNAGLHRFDGIRFEKIPTTGHDPAQDDAVSALMASRDGALWIGFQSGRVGVLDAGRLRDRTPPGSERWIYRFHEDRRGSVWVQTGTWGRELMRRDAGGWANVDRSWGLDRPLPSPIAEDRHGGIWAVYKGDIMVLAPGERRFRPTGMLQPLPPLDGFGIAADRDGRIWMSSRVEGTRRLADVVGGEQVRARGTRIAAHPSNDSYRRPLFDRDGAIWGVTGSAGIFRIADPHALYSGGSPAEEVFNASDGLSSDAAEAILEDREGNIWVGTSSGLDRFRAASVHSVTGVPPHSRFGYLLMVARDGSIHAADSDSVWRAPPGHDAMRLMGGLDNPQALCDDAGGAVWLATRSALYRAVDGRFRPMPQPRGRPSFLDCVATTDGGLWFSAFGGGLRRYESGALVEVLRSTEQPPPAVTNMVAWRDGGLIANLRGQALVRIAATDVRPLWNAAGIPGGEVTALFPYGDSLLVASLTGLARLEGGRVTMLRRDEPWLKAISGIVDDGRGDLWLLSRAGIARVPLAELARSFDDPRRPLRPTMFTAADGLPGTAAAGAARNSAARGGDGRLWFVTTDGIARIDPARLVHNPLPPPVHITALAFGRARLRDPAKVALPAGVARVEIDYTALSLTIPERVRFRYRLQGSDSDWVDPGGLRQATYTNLAPGSYRFRVIAANNDGVWNEQGATLEFTIPPTFVQSAWFKLLMGLLAAALAWAAYAARLRSERGRMQARFDALVGERQRIARDLHDTLLQEFQGLLLRFQAVADQLPAGDLAGRALESALDRADAALAEGRDRVLDLRVAQAHSDLPQAAAELATHLLPAGAPRFRILVEGEPRELDPVAAEETLRIIEEAMRNVARHADASLLELRVDYGAGGLRVTVRDDGRGLDADPPGMGVGRAHFGLLGMRERATRIGATLSFGNRPEGGAQASIFVPRKHAYRSWRPWSRR